MIDFTTPSAKRAEIIGAGALILIVLGLTLLYMATHEAPQPYQVLEAPVEPAPEPLAPQVFEEHGQYYDIVASYPAETALKATLGPEADEEAVSVMAEFVADTVDDFMAQGDFDNLTPEDIQIMGLSETRKESLLMDYEIKGGAHTVSYVFTLFLDTLGAHPNTFFRTFTFDLADGDVLAIEDLFVPRSNYLTRLSAIAEFELSRSLGDSVDIDYIRQGVTPEALNFQSFAIEGADLILIFPPYQVAPYAAGTQQVSIPLDDLAEVLKDEYQP